MNKKWLIIFSVLYITWSAVFIFNTSVVGIDGKRHFLLFDDAMISMRYAWNLSHGNGLVWNSGEYVEGITNFLMTLVMALSTLLLQKNIAILSIHIFGIVVMLLIAYICMRIGEIISKRAGVKQSIFLSVLFFICGVIYYPLSFWSVLGMETGLLSLLLLASTWIALQNYGKEKASLLLPILLGLSFYSRPDAAIFIAIIMVFRLSGIYKFHSWFKIIFIEAGVVGIFIAALTIFRFFYYGSIVPNTYTLKMVGMPFLFRIENGMLFILPFLKTIWFPIVIAIFGVIRKKDIFSLLLATLFLTSIVYQIYVGGDPWPYWRMSSPFMPLLLILCISELSFFFKLTKIDNGKRQGQRNNALDLKYESNTTSQAFRKKIVIKKSAVCLFFIAIVFLVNMNFKQYILFREVPPEIFLNKKQVDKSIILNQILGESATIGLFTAGAISFFVDRKSHDFLGKCDETIASLKPDLSGAVSWNGLKSVPGHNKYDLNYSIVKLKPTYVAVSFMGVGKWGRDDVFEFLKNNYVLLITDSGLHLLLKKQSPDILWDRISSFGKLFDFKLSEES